MMLHADPKRRAAKRATLASPLTFFGYPLPAWGDPKYYKIRLKFFQEPGEGESYCGTLEGSTTFFEELDDVWTHSGPGRLRQTVHVCATAVGQGKRKAHA
jgi:hypothetical protein